MQLSIFCLSFLFVFAAAKEFTPCEIAKALLEEGVSRTNMPRLICMAKKNSPNLDPNVKNGPDEFGTTYFGLFGIDDYNMCKNGDKTSVNSCKGNCDEFQDDNLSNDGVCLSDQQHFEEMDIMPHYKDCLNADKDEMLGDCDY